jgi:hypothetical protein
MVPPGRTAKAPRCALELIFAAIIAVLAPAQDSEPPQVAKEVGLGGQLWAAAA